MAEKNETEGRCPACRTIYEKEKIVTMQASCERLAFFCDLFIIFWCMTLRVWHLSNLFVLLFFPYVRCRELNIYNLLFFNILYRTGNKFASRKNKPPKGKPKINEVKKDLTNVRVIQRKMAYVIGLPLSLADEDVGSSFILSFVFLEPLSSTYEQG